MNQQKKSQKTSGRNRTLWRRRSKQGHKDEFDPNAPKGSEEEVPGKPGIKNPDTGEL